MSPSSNLSHVPCHIPSQICGFFCFDYYCYVNNISMHDQSPLRELRRLITNVHLSLSSSKSYPTSLSPLLQQNICSGLHFPLPPSSVNHIDACLQTSFPLFIAVSQAPIPIALSQNLPGHSSHGSRQTNCRPSSLHFIKSNLPVSCPTLLQIICFSVSRWSGNYRSPASVSLYSLHHSQQMKKILMEHYQ